MAIQEALLHIRNKDLKSVRLKKIKNHLTVAFVEFRHHIIEQHHRPVPMVALDRQGQGSHQKKRAQTLLALGRIAARFSTSVINGHIIALRPKERLPQRRFGALQTARLSAKTLTEQWLRRCSHEERSTFLRRTVCQHRRAVG